MLRPALRVLTVLFALGAFAPLASAVSPGASAPEIALPDLGGKSIKLSSLRGKVVLVDFWASWCGPCREELPWLEKLYAARHAKGLELVAVNQDESVENAKKFLRAHPLSFPVVHDAGGKIADRYAPSKMPSSYLIDGKGQVRFVHGGFRASDAKTIEAEVDKLLAELK